jgi:hypothetical protein
LLPHSRSHYFSYLCNCLELLHIPNGRTIDYIEHRSNRTRPYEPFLTCQNSKMATTSNESKVNLILNQPSDWTQWFFIIQDTAWTNKVWQYIDPSKTKDKLPKLEPPHRPTPKDVLPIDSEARRNTAHRLQPALHRMQRRSPSTPKARTGYQRYQQLHCAHDIGSLPPTHRRPRHGTRTATGTQECTSPYHLRSKARRPYAVHGSKNLRHNTEHRQNG